MKKHRLAATAAVGIALIAAFVYLPLPFHIQCHFEVQPRGATPVFAGVPGKITEVAVKPGYAVKEGEVLAKLENIDLQLEVIKLEGEQARLESELSGLEKQRFSDDRASLQILAVQEMLETTKEQLREKQLDLQRLTIIAPMDGYVFPAPLRPHRETGDGRLPQWSGSPFDPKNAGALLSGADQFCQIGKSTSYEAVLIIDQADVNLVHGYVNKHNAYPDVKIKFDAYRWKSIDGAIEKLASAPMEATPASLSTQGGGTLETKTDKKTGTLKTISTSYQASVPLDDQQELLRVGLTGKAKIYTGWQPLYERTYRYIARTFHFDW